MPIFLHFVQVVIDFVEQAVVFAGGHGPALVAGIAEIEGDPDVGEVHLVHRHFIGVDQGQIDLAFINHAQQVDDFNRVGFFILDAGVFLFQLCQLFGVGAAFEHHDLLADQVTGVGWSRLAVAIDDLRGNFQVGVRKPDLFFTFFAADQTGCSQHRAVRLADLTVKVVEVVGSLDLEFHPQIFGEALHQLVFEAGFAVAILEVGGGAVSGNHAQHAILLYALQCVGFINTAIEQQEESGCDQPFGVPRTQKPLGKTSAQYTQRTTSRHISTDKGLSARQLKSAPEPAGMGLESIF